MIYKLSKEGSQLVEIHFPVQHENEWIVEETDYEYKETTKYSFITREQAEFFLEYHLHSFKEDGYHLEVVSLLTDLEK